MAIVRITRNGVIQGISYSKDGISFSGTHLGAAYTFNGLQKHLGVSYLNSRDDARLISSNHLSLKQDWRSEASSERDKPGFWLQKTAQSLIELLDVVEGDRFAGKIFTTTRIPGKEPELNLWRNEGNSQLLKLKYSYSNKAWETLSTPSLTYEDLERLHLLETRLRMLKHHFDLSRLKKEVDFQPENALIKPNKQVEMEL
ncbi:MAG: hypothetical protein HC764_26045 [Pleurocapsa sp. CRU_1_2]|nr:hypothetical protein [Pleurocapsa sp. CRU_1_2]